MKEIIPMKYYKFLCYLPIIWIVVNIGKLILYRDVTLVAKLISVCVLLISPIVFYGLMKKKWCGVILLNIVWFSNLLISVWDIVQGNIPEDFTTSIYLLGSVLGYLIVAIPTNMYLSKRRHLFT